MKACGTANYWGRKLKELGHQVKLINPKYVKPYVKRNKNDMNDAAGIAAAARNPDMRFCDVKTEAQQDMQSMHRIRSLLVRKEQRKQTKCEGCWCVILKRIAIMGKVIKIKKKVSSKICRRH